MPFASNPSTLCERSLVIKVSLNAPHPWARTTVFVPCLSDAVVDDWQRQWCCHGEYAGHSRPPNAAAAYEEGVGPDCTNLARWAVRLPGWSILRPSPMLMKHEFT